MEPVRIEFLMVDKLSARLDKAVGKMEQLAGKSAQAGRQMQELDKSGVSLQKTIGRIASAFAVKELVGKIATVRGEFQQLEVAFKTMLGSAEKADALMAQLTHTAAITPFGMEDVAQGAKQLLAYGFEAEKVNETLIRLGDIAAGLSVPLNDLVYLYGTTMAQGRLYTQDLNQFTGRGIPMISELAKQFGVAESKVRELVEAGKVGFPEVQKVIESLTGEGSKFGGLMEAQSKTITGQISNIEDAIAMMMNELGQQSEGVINTTLSGVSHIIEHYERFGRILLSVAGTYGVYRTAVMAVVAAKGWATAAEALHYNWLLLVEKAQKALNATMLKNPYILVATLVAGAVAAIVSMKTETERMKAAEEAYGEQKQKTIEAEEEHRKKIEELCSIAANEAVSTDTRREALNKLEQKYPDIFAKYDTEYEKLKNIKKIKEEIALIDADTSIAKPENELKAVNERIKELEGKTKWVSEYYQDSYGRQRARNVQVSARTKDEEAELQALYGKRKSLGEQIRKDGVNAYFENLTGVSNETLAQQIKERETLLARMTMREEEFAEITQGKKTLRGTYNRDELQYQLNKLRSEQNRRAKPTDSSSDWAAAARKKYEDALKAYNDFLKDATNSLTQEEFEKKAKALKEAADTAKKEYDKAKPGEDADAEKEKKAAEKAEKEAEKRKQTFEKLGQELAELQRENDASEIDTMQDGLQKKLRQIANDYHARKNEIARQEAAWREDNKKAGNTDINAGGLTADQQAAIDRSTELNDETRRTATERLYKELTDRYQSYTDKRLEIEKRYNDDIEDLRRARQQAEASGDSATVAKIDRSAAEATRAKGVALAAHDFEVLRQSPEYVKAFEDLRSSSTETLTALLEQFERAKTAAGSALNPEDLREYTTTIREIMDEIDSRDPLGTLTKRAEELTVAERQLAEAKSRLDAVRRGDKILTGLKADGTGADGKPILAATYLSEAEALKQYTEAKDKHTKAGNNFVKAEEEARDKVSQFAEAIKGVGEAIGGTAGEIVGLVMDVGTFITESIDGIVTVQKAGEEAVSAVEKASIILGIVSTAIGLLRKIGELGSNGTFKEYEAYAGKIEDINALTATVDQYRLAVLEARREEDAWFAGDSLQSLKDWKAYHDEVYNAYTEKAMEAQAVYHNESGGGWLTGGLNWLAGNLSMLSWWDKWRNLWGQGGYEEGTTAAINNLRIETRKKSSGFLGTGIGSKSQKTEDLATWARNNGLGELFDDGGLIDKELAQSILDNYGDKLVGQTKETLETLIELREKYDEYIEQLHEYVSSMYEPLVDNFVDGLWDWLDSGKDALDAFKDYASDTFRDIVSDMLRTIVIKKVIGSFDDDIAAVYEKYAAGEMDEQGLMGEVAKLTEDLTDRYENNLPTLENLLETVRGRLEAAGIDIRSDDSGTSGTSQSGKAGSFTAMTQDQGTKLEGTFTSGLQHWSSMDEKMENVSEKMNSAENHLAKIEENTGKSAGHLADIKEEIKKIVRDGLKMK